MIWMGNPQKVEKKKLQESYIASLVTLPALN